MKGLERITQRIQTDAQGQIEALTAAGRRQAQEITEKYEDQARQLRQADQEKAARDAQQDQRRAQSGADRTRREQLLACKQQLIDDTFRQARQQLTQLPREKYVHLLVQLAVKTEPAPRRSSSPRRTHRWDSRCWRVPTLRDGTSACLRSSVPPAGG